MANSMKGEHDILRMDPEERSQLQLERLQSTLNRAYRNVPFHQNRLSEKGIDPLDITRIGELASLPFMERQQLGDFYPYGLFAVPLRDIVRIHTAPGTGDNPTVSGYTQQDLRVWQEMVIRALAAATVTPHDILQISLDPGLANWGRDYKDGAEAMEVSVIPNTPLSLEKQLMVLRDYKTTVFLTTPSYASQLSRHMFKAALNPTALNLRTLLLVGEPVGADFRKALEDKLHVKTWVNYGLSEIPGPAVAFECQAHQGLHLNEDHFVAEIIDPLSGEVLPEGQSGELILTTLTTRAFPLIRFRTGDRARLLTQACACGCTFRRIEWFAERTDDLLLIRGVKVHGRQIELQIRRALGFVPSLLRFVEKRLESRHYLEVWLALEDQLFSDEIKMLENLMHTMAERLQENIGVPVKVRLKEKRSF